MSKKHFVIILIITFVLNSSCDLYKFFDFPSSVLFQNRTNTNIIEIYFVHNNSDSWEDNILPNTLLPFQEFKYPNISIGIYKTKIVFFGDISYQINNIELINKELKIVTITNKD